MDIISTTLTNPCPLPKEKGQLGKSRGLCAWDLIKPRSRFKTIKTQQEIQECSKPSFDHPKMLHILIDRAAGYGCKKLAKAHGGSAGSISKFCQSMGFDIIKPGREEHQRIYDDQWMKEIKSTRKDVTWAQHPAVYNYFAMKKYYADNPIRPTYYSKEERKQRNKESRRRSARRQRNNPLFRIKENARKRSRKYIKTPGLSWAGFGCTSDEYRAHMEKQFTKRMTWDNYGTYWHDDHIRPMSSFDWSDPEQRRQCEHYTNKQPLEAKKNIAKSDLWDGQIGFNHMLCI